jgi:hypothetical protein
MAGNAIAQMDRRTWQALTKGYVELPRRRIHAGIWFRLLRTFLDELNTPLSQCGGYSDSIRYVWGRSGHPLRAGQSLWHPYEILNQAIQLQMLEAAATAMELIETQVLNPIGEQAALFLPEQQAELTNGLPVVGRKKELVNYWQKTVTAINEAVAEARYNPEIARSLFAFASYGRHDPESLERLRAIFIQDGVPPDFLSHYVPDGHFTCRRQNDVLSDKL